MFSVRALLPKNKFDLDAVSKLQTLDCREIEPLLEDLVAWIADGNWPVAKPLADLLVSVGRPAIPALRKLLQGADATHQYFSLLLVVSKFPPDVSALLQNDLKKIVEAPTVEQNLEGVSELAADVLRKLGNVCPKEQP